MYDFVRNCVQFCTLLRTICTELRTKLYVIAYNIEHDYTYKIVRNALHAKNPA